MTPDDVARAFETLQARGSEVFAFDPVVGAGLRHFASGPCGDADSVASNDLVESSLLRAATTWEARAECEAAIGTIFRNDFLTLDALIGISEALMRQLTNSDLGGIPQQVAYAASTIAARSHATAHEISALLRAALPDGAHARWRTLHELQVVASVLRGGGVETASRYNDHRWVKFAEDRKYADPKPPWTGETPEEAVVRLTREYGPAFAKNYGWAEPQVKKLLGKDTPVTWPNLVKLAELSESHLSHVKTAHHLVHADALGAIHLISSEGLLSSGPRIEGIPDIVALTATTLIGTMDALVDAWHQHDASDRVEVLATMMDSVFADLLVNWAHRVALDTTTPG